MKQLAIVLILLFPLFFNGQKGKEIVTSFIEDCKSDKSIDEILEKQIINFDKKTEKDKNIQKYVLQSLRDNLNSPSYQSFEVFKRDDSEFVWKKERKNSEIYEAKIQHLDSCNSVFFHLEDNKIKSFMGLNKGGTKYFTY